MDEKIRLLLRKYAISRDPQDAVKAINAILRIESSPVVIWICDIYEGSDNGSVIELCLTEEEAILKAANWLVEILERDYISADAPEDIRYEFATYHNNLKSAIKNNNFAVLCDLVRRINRDLVEYSVNVYSQAF